MSVRITTLGQVRVSVAGRERPSLPQQRLRCALLVYLAVEAECARESLIGVFWPDRPTARGRHILSQCLYELRQTLGEDIVQAEGDRVVIGSAVSIDAREFEQNVERGELEAALSAYDGPFLDGFSLPNNGAFEMWADRVRASIERLHRRGRREQIQRLEEAGEATRAVAAARVWAEVQPLEDEAQHKLFELLLAAGERLEARTRFEQYSRVLREELDVAPLDETVALFESGSPSWPASAAPPSPPPSTGAAIETGHAERHAPGRSEEGEAARAQGDASDSSPGSVPALQESDGFGVTRTAGPREEEGAAARDVAADPAAAPSLRSPLARRIRWWPVAIAAAAVVASMLVVTRVFDDPPRPQALGLQIDPAGYDPSRIAVLYFEDLSEEKHLGHIASGLTEALITELNHVEVLSVVSRDGVKPFVDSIVPPQRIAAALRAGSIVGGSVQRSRDQLRLTVQLVEGSTGSVLESATFQRTMGELFQLQDDLARQVARILRDRIGREVSIRRLTAAGKPEAWELVRRAMDAAEDIWLTEGAIASERRRSAQLALDAADEYLRRAERIDRNWSEPTLLRGWTALGRAKLIGIHDTVAYNREIRAGLGIAQGLFARGITGAREHELRGTLRHHLARANRTDLRYLAVRDSAERDLRMAVSRDPTLARASNRLSALLLYAGNPREARHYANHALQQDAYLRDGADIQIRLYLTSLELQDFSAAGRYCLAGRGDYPRDWRFLQCQLMTSVYGTAPIPPDSAQVLLRLWTELDPMHAEGPPRYAYVFRRLLYAAVLARDGQHELARDSLDRIRRDVERHPDHLGPPFGLDEASILLMLGDTTGALRAVGDYLRANPMYRSYVERGFQVKPLHGDPRFIAIVRDTVSG